MGTITWLRPNQSPVVEEATKPPTMDKLREYVDGWVELVRVLDPDDKPAQLIVNEEGAIQGLEFNEIGTKHYSRFSEKKWGRPAPSPIVGNAVLLQGADVELD